MSDYINETGARLAALRKEKGLTQKKVAEIIGINEKSYTVWEIGRRKKSNKIGETMRKEKEAIDISNAHLCALADLYGVSVDYILGRSPYKAINGADIAKITGLSDSAIRILQEYQADDCPYPDPASTASLLIQDMENNKILKFIEDFLSIYPGSIDIPDADVGRSLPSIVPNAEAINDLSWMIHSINLALNHIRREFINNIDG